MFQALVLRKSEDTPFSAAVESLAEEALNEGEVRVGIEWSTLNFKDALALTHKGPVVRRWPMVPGIDGAGHVLESRHADWKPGDRVIHNGWGVGETAWGCLAEQARLPGAGLVALPAGLSSRQAMLLGTAGYTAMLCVMALERHGLKPGDGEVLVTGATGGVGSVAIALLAGRGYRVVAATGKTAEVDYLRRLGASDWLDRTELGAPGKPLQKERWAGAVDALGGSTLANVLAQTRYGGAVAACGLAQSGELSTTVMPFILRGVALLGVDSVMAPLPLRREAWARLSAEMDTELLEQMLSGEIALADAPAAAQALMEGRQRGRWIVHP